jgi:excisionase family DNA binding protein
MPTEQYPPTPVALRTRDVCRRLNVSRETLRRWRSSGHFPEPRLLGPRSLAWDSDVIDAWFKSRPTVSLQGGRDSE